MLPLQRKVTKNYKRFDKKHDKKATSHRTATAALRTAVVGSNGAFVRCGQSAAQ